MTFIISSTSFYVPPMHFGCNERPSKVKPSTYSSWKIWKIISKCVYKQISINFKKVTILYHCALCDASTVMHKCNTHHSTKNSKEKTVHNLQNLQPTNFPLNWDISVVKYAFFVKIPEKIVLEKMETKQTCNFPYDTKKQIWTPIALKSFDVRTVIDDKCWTV